MIFNKTKFNGVFIIELEKQDDERGFFARTWDKKEFKKFSKQEFGFDWHTQYYFDPSVSEERRKEFEFYIEPVFIEDVQAIEKQKGPWFPIVTPYNRLEEHCVHYGQWVKKNREVR